MNADYIHTLDWYCKRCGCVARCSAGDVPIADCPYEQEAAELANQYEAANA
jgi:hypothetical protein